jgi:hypothetical protein
MGPGTGKERKKMRRLGFLVVLLAVAGSALAGCQNIRGPFQPRPQTRPDDPRFPISEQERRARDQVPLPDESSEVGPQSGNAYPGLPNRRI